MNRPFLYIVFCALMLALQLPTKAQVNLVPNGSFEEYDTCPGDVGQITYAKYWYSPTLGSPDYFNMCTTSQCPNYVDIGVPNNRYGYQYPRTGFGYAGLEPYVSWLDTNQDYLEYLQIRLLSPLIINTKYKLTVFISIANISTFAINSFAALFTSNLIVNNNSSELILVPSCVFSEFYSDTSNWIELNAIYTATGGEEFLTFGNFNYSVNTDTLRIGLGMEGGRDGINYLYIDDVSLTQQEQITEIFPNVFTPNDDGYNDTFNFWFTGSGTMSIFNRWGVKVFEKFGNNNIEWDGKYMGEYCSDGVYYYILSKIKNENVKGSIQLIK